MFRLTDTITPQRSVIVDADAIAPTVGQWIAADAGAFTVDLSPNVVALARALRHNDWRRVHEIADHLRLSVEVL